MASQLLRKWSNKCHAQAQEIESTPVSSPPGLDPLKNHSKTQQESFIQEHSQSREYKQGLSQAPLDPGHSPESRGVKLCFLGSAQLTLKPWDPPGSEDWECISVVPAWWVCPTAWTTQTHFRAHLERILQDFEQIHISLCLRTRILPAVFY